MLISILRFSWAHQQECSELLRYASFNPFSYRPISHLDRCHDSAGGTCLCCTGRSNSFAEKSYRSSSEAYRLKTSIEFQLYYFTSITYLSFFSPLGWQDGVENWTYGVRFISGVCGIGVYISASQSIYYSAKLVFL
jgi:hypothetical protein